MTERRGCPSELESAGYDAFSARYGHVYTVRQLLQLWKRSMGLLEPIDTKKLPRRDVALLAATQEVAKRLHEPPNEDAVKQAAPAAADTNKSDGGAMAIIRLAEAALSHSDALLSGGTR